MNNNVQNYKKTEKWWLILIVLFYLLYNLPGLPQYGNATGAIWHGLLTLVPLWLIIYFGLFRLLKQKQLREYKNDEVNKEANGFREGV